MTTFMIVLVTITKILTVVAGVIVFGCVGVMLFGKHNE